jgi:hypothetical protein
MVTEDDPSKLSDATLIQEYVANVQSWNTDDHVGKLNRIMKRRFRIVDELKTRSDGTLQPLRGLLDHADPKVRHSAAIHFRTIDHAAFERTVRALAERTDEIGNDAKMSLMHDAHFQKFGYPEAQKTQVVPSPTIASKVHWQCDNPPSETMRLAEIKRLLANGLPARSAVKIQRLARCAIGLWPQRPPARIEVGASRLGGMPDAPSTWSWPMVDTEPMVFLGQINCADIQGIPGAEKLPVSGLLAFFADHDAIMGCGNYTGGAVFHWPNELRLTRAEPPIEVMHLPPLCTLTFRHVIDLPDPNSNVVQAILTDQALVKRYEDVNTTIRFHGIPDHLHFYCGLSKLLGWPSLVQLHDLDTPDRNEPAGMRLLLQLDQYSNGTDSEGWGPGGSLYFMLSDSDMREHRFDGSEFEGQFT